MNRARRKRLERLAHAQRALADAAAVRERSAVVSHRESADAAGKILGALGAESPLHGHLVLTMATALDNNARETSRLEDAVRACETARVAADTRARALERRHAEAEKSFRRDRERRALEAMVTPAVDPHAPESPPAQASDQPDTVT